MTPPLATDEISAEDFFTVLSRYDALVHSLSKPSSDGNSLKELDVYRLTAIPERLRSIREGGGDLYLEKVEVERLIRWKLKHGKFRPRLEQLVASNSSSEIEAISRSAFTLLHNDTAIQTAVLPALDKLTELKGIGPASTSLLLSVCDPDSVPFFSDEAFHWVMAGVDFAGNPGGKNWDRKIKYNRKEYGEYIKRVRGLMKRLGGDIKAVDVERVGWVLGRERAVLRSDVVGDGGSPKTALAVEEVKVVKRKATAANASAHGQTGTRRSKRLRS